MLWLKALHIIAMVCWFAALFYLPRLFVYHAMTTDDAVKAQFKIMERKLYRGIGTPSMVATLVLGFWLVSLNSAYYLQAGWFHTKMLLVALLVGYHFACGHYLRQLRDGRCQRGHKFFRWFNEAPVLVLVGAIVLAVVKPF